MSSRWILKTETFSLSFLCWCAKRAARIILANQGAAKKECYVVGIWSLGYYYCIKTETSSCFSGIRHQFVSFIRTIFLGTMSQRASIPLIQTCFVKDYLLCNSWTNKNGEKRPLRWRATWENGIICRMNCKWKQFSERGRCHAWQHYWSSCCHDANGLDEVKRCLAPSFSSD